jgi:hypothetical protein
MRHAVPAARRRSGGASCPMIPEPIDARRVEDADIGAFEFVSSAMHGAD